MIMDEKVEEAPRYLGSPQADLNDILEEVILLLVPETQEGLRIKLELGSRPLMAHAESEQVFWAVYHFLRHILKLVHTDSENPVMPFAVKIATGRQNGHVFLRLETDKIYNIRNESSRRQQLLIALEDRTRLQDRLRRLGGVFEVTANDDIPGSLTYRMSIPQAI